MRIFCKRAVRRLVIFLLLLVAPMAALQVSNTETPPPAGFCLAEETASAQRIRDYLCGNGFVPVADPETLREQVRRGALDCGAVFPEDLTQRIVEGKLKGSVQFYAAPSSFSPDLYKSHIAAILFREYTPYICADAFENTKVTQERVLAEYEAMFARGHVFSFDVVAVGDAQVANPGNHHNMAIGAAAILLLAALFALAAETVDCGIAQMLPRLGLEKSITRILLPETGISLVLAVVFAGGGLALAGLPAYWLPTAVYCIGIWGCGLVLYGILWSAKRIYVLLPVLVIAGLALCPIYTDLSILLPWLEQVRCVLPPYWLWCIPNNLGLWAGVCLTILAGGIGLIALRCRWLHKYK